MSLPLPSLSLSLIVSTFASLCLSVLLLPLFLLRTPLFSLPTSVPILVSASVSIPFRSSSLSFDRCFSLDSTVTLCSRLNSGSSPPSITLAVQAPAAQSEGGWIGFGFSPSNGDFPMLGSSAVIGRASMNGNIEGVDNFELTAKDPSGVVVTERRLQLINKDVAINAQGILTMVFTRPLILSSSSSASSFASIRSDSPNSCIWALGPLPASSTSPLSQHLYRNFGSVDFSTGSVSLNDRIPRYRKVHAFLMCPAILLFLTSGILIARFGKSFGPYWYYAHIGCQLTAVMAATAGFGIGLAVIGTGYYTTHRATGITAMTLLYLQLLNIPFKPHLPPPGEGLSIRRRVWNFIHRSTGRLAYLLGVINVFIGMIDVYVVTQSVVVGVTVGWGFLISLGAALEIMRRCSKTGMSGANQQKRQRQAQPQGNGKEAKERVVLGLASGPAALLDGDDYAQAASRDGSRDNSMI